MSPSPTGRLILREQQSGTDPIALGEKVGETLLHRGATKILGDVYGGEADHRSRKHQLQPRSQCLCAGTGVVPGSRELVAESTAMLSSLGFL